MRVFALVWGVALVVVGVGAMRACTTLWKMAEREASRAEVQAATRRALRWSWAIVGLGCVMGVVSPWLRA